MLSPTNHAFATERMPPATVPTPSPVVAAAPTAVDQNPSHTDYDLHPLTVRNLDHYIEHDHAGERFHVH
jgi:3-oxoacyl-ACP reductase-like protein